MANRVIKFRAWDGVQMWYQGQGKTTLMFWGQPGKIPFGIYEETDGRRIMTGDDKAILNNPAILMQFTGLTDKNGVEIYEGDVLTNYGFASDMKIRKFLVEWATQNSRYVLRDGKVKTSLFDYDVIQCEIIGNIYENPELLNP